jgi:tellurite resistance protein
MATKKPGGSSALADIEKHAAKIRSELKFPKQNEVFRTAVEAGYLTAAADGEVDEEERSAMVRAVELLSEGVVIEWETESLLGDCEARAKKDGSATRIEAVGKALSDLGQAEAGLYFATLVARASKGIDQKEKAVLTGVGAAAGLAADRVTQIITKAGTLG